MLYSHELKLEPHSQSYEDSYDIWNQMCLRAKRVQLKGRWIPNFNISYIYLRYVVVHCARKLTSFNTLNCFFLAKRQYGILALCDDLRKPVSFVGRRHRRSSSITK